MSFALNELTRLLTPATTQLGSVVGVTGNTARVATAKGAITARSVDALSVGDRVQIINGIATKAPVARQVYPV